MSTGNVGLVVTGLGLVGSFALQRLSERKIDALPTEAREALDERLKHLRFGLVGIAAGVALFLALGRGRTAIFVSVAILLANALAIAAARIWASAVLPADARASFRGLACAQLAASTALFVGGVVYVLR